MKFDRKLWMQIHLYLSLFFLPAAFIYALTGALYLFDLREEAGAKVHEIKLDSMPEKGQEKEFIIQTLEANQLPVPKNTDVRMHRGNPAMGGLTYSVSLSLNKQGEPQLRAVDRSLYGILLLMHKAKGSKYEIGSFKLGLFDFIAIGFALSLMIFYFSGLVITSFCKKNRASAFGVFVGGLFITSLAIYLSV
ncbi:hypothetical protein LS68_004610 [Helicobacter sp. MIT 05-5293]|uniref:hypothetical protein n=1 Tax=Helicobacter sp. MIT 05-5293 TaxID=1548149 RepID=UPI00051E015B|nr:hypothetical protein [Helicobacter sp. MIT 05-5293]TLD80771.1 hypothetical protein LS68_004610 [Helicobacter sp. MIT 05-5293]